MARALPAGDVMKNHLTLAAVLAAGLFMPVPAKAQLLPMTDKQRADYESTVGCARFTATTCAVGLARELGEYVGRAIACQPDLTVKQYTFLPIAWIMMVARSKSETDAALDEWTATIQAGAIRQLTPGRQQNCAGILKVVETFRTSR
jgi:hypothetical protein